MGKSESKSARRERSRPEATRTHSPAGKGPGSAVWVGSKKPVFVFVGVFVVLMGIFYGITFIDLVDRHVLKKLMIFNAQASVAVMNVFGEGATPLGTNITSSRYSVNIAHGCDAIEPIALFVAAVLAFPAPWRSKVPGLLIGTLVLTAINIVRIISLFYVGIHWKGAFDTMHEDVWQPAFIVLSLVLWVIWALWATKPRTASHHALA